MLIIVGFALVGVAALYYVLSRSLPGARVRRTQRFAAHTGQKGVVSAPADRFGAHLLPGPIARRLRGAMHLTDPQRYGLLVDRMVVLALGVAGIALLIVESVPPAVVAGILAPVVVFVRERRRALAFERDFLLQLPDCLLLIASAMRTGRNFVNALRASIPNLSEPMKSQMEALADRIEALRVTEAQAFEMWAETLTYPQLRTAAAALSIGNTVGIETDVVFRRLSETLQGEITADMETRAATAQVRSSSTVVSLVPVGVLGIIYLIDPAFIKPLFTSVGGWIVLGVAVLLNGGAFALSRRILARLTA
jgi:tight adherence protein B